MSRLPRPLALATLVLAVKYRNDGLFREQAAERDRARREATLHKMQKLLHERAAFGPIWDFAFLHGVGPRVEEAGLGLLGSYGFSAPYEDVKLKAR
jgi:peptide/nickel transport system substrate-binding protein